MILWRGFEEEKKRQPKYYFIFLFAKKKSNKREWNGFESLDLMRIVQSNNDEVYLIAK